MLYRRIELVEGEPVVFLAVHALRWPWDSGIEPTAGFVETREDEIVVELAAELAAARGKVEALTGIIERQDAELAHARLILAHLSPEVLRRACDYARIAALSAFGADERMRRSLDAAALENAALERAAKEMER